VRCLPTASALPLKKDFGTSRWQLWYQATRLARVCEGQRSTRTGSAPTILTPGEMTQHDPCRASALAWRTGSDDDGLLGALQPLNLLIKLGDARSRSGSQRAAECLLSSRDRPSFAAVATAGMCQNRASSWANRTMTVDRVVDQASPRLLRYARSEISLHMIDVRNCW
jgi:hypothetical protein